MQCWEMADDFHMILMPFFASVRFLLFSPKKQLLLLYYAGQKNLPNTDENKLLKTHGKKTSVVLIVQIEAKNIIGAIYSSNYWSLKKWSHTNQILI